MAELGFAVKPIAGMGGSVGPKRTDEREILEKARESRVKSVAPV